MFTSSSANEPRRTLPASPQPEKSRHAKPRDLDHLDLRVDVTFRGVYDPNDVAVLQGVGDVAFEYFPGHPPAW